MDVEKFYDWLVDRKGLDPSTAEQYCNHASTAFAIGPFKRLKDDTLAPNTRHLIKASLKKYASFTKDVDFSEELKDFRLPPVGRIQEKLPFSKEEWSDVREGIRLSGSISDNMKCVLALMAVRGFRVGDVLRLKREDVLNSLSSKELIFKAKRGKRLAWSVTAQMKPFLESLAQQESWATVADLISPRANIDRRQTSAIIAVERALKQVAAEVDLDPRKVYPHRLRRTVATYALEKFNGDLTKLKSWFGWSNIVTAASYADYHERSELDKLAEEMF